VENPTEYMLTLSRKIETYANYSEIFQIKITDGDIEEVLPD